MNGIKVKINDPGPDRELIRKYKNFDRFMDRYKRYYSTRGIREMLYNDRRKLIYIVIILLSLLLLLISYEESEGGTTYREVESSKVTAFKSLPEATINKTLHEIEFPSGEAIRSRPTKPLAGAASYS